MVKGAFELIGLPATPATTAATTPTARAPFGFTAVGLLVAFVLINLDFTFSLDFSLASGLGCGPLLSLSGLSFLQEGLFHRGSGLDLSFYFIPQVDISSAVALGIRREIMLPSKLPEL